MEKNIYLGKPVVDLNTGQKWKSISECARSLESSKSSITRAAESEGRRTFKGYRLVYEGIEKVYDLEVKEPKLRAIIDLDTGEKWSSAADFAYEFGVSTSTVSRALSSKGKSICSGHRIIREVDL